MSEKKERIAGKAWNKIQFLVKEMEKKRDELVKWQKSFFEPGKALESYFHDQINFTAGVVMEYGGIVGKPLGRIPKGLQRQAVKKQEEIDALDKDLKDTLTRIAHKLSIKKGKTIYRDQIDIRTGELKELPPDTTAIEIDDEEDDEVTMQAVLEEQKKKEKISKLFDDEEEDETDE